MPPPPTNSPDPEQLLEHASWLRRFARALALDDAAADDLVQDAFGAAITSRRPIRDLRAFLGGAVRRRSAETRRTELRRRRREESHAADREPTLPGADEAAERVEAMRVLLDELQALPAAQRDALTLRYVDGLEPVEIARRGDVSPATVRAHVSRGLAALRERLDRRCGGRSGWTAAFVPWLGVGGRDVPVLETGGAAAPTGAAGAVLTTGVALMSTKIVAAVLAPLALVGLWFGLDRADPSAVEQDARREAAAPDADATLADVQPDALGRRATVEDAGAGAAPADAPAPTVADSTHPVEGTAVDELTGEPVPALSLRIRSIDPRGFEMPNDAIHAGIEVPEQYVQDGGGESTTLSQSIHSGGLPGNDVKVVTGRDGSFRSDSTLLAGRVAVIEQDGLGELPILPRSSVHEFPFPAPIPVEVGPTFRFAMTIPDGLNEARFRAHFVDPNVPGFRSPQATLRPGNEPWVRFPFAVTRLEGEGPWTLSVTDDQGLWRASTEVTRKLGIEPVPIPLTLEPFGALEFRVSRSDGMAAPVLFVDVENVETGDADRVFLDVDTAATVTSGIAKLLSPGPHRWTAGPRSGEVVVVGGVVTPVEVEIDYGGATFDAVVRIDATAVEPREIQMQRFVVVSADDVSNVVPVEAKRNENDPDGFWQVEVEGLPAGTWNLVPMTGFSTLRWDPKRIALEPGGVPETLVATSRGPMVSVELTVLDADTNEPIGGAEIAWNCGGPDYAMVTTGDDGVGRSTDLPNEDESHALVRAPGYGLTCVRLVPAEDGMRHEVRLDRGWRGLVRVMALEDFSVVGDIEVIVDGRSAGWTGDDGFVWIEGEGPPELIELGEDAPKVLMSPFDTPGLDAGDPLLGWTFLVGRR